MGIMRISSLSLVLGVAIHACTAHPIMVVNLTSAPLATKIAVQVCVGLFNRDGSAGYAYTIGLSGHDADWFMDIDGYDFSILYHIPDFLAMCLNSTSGVAKGYIRYNLTSQQVIVPNIITLAAVLDAVPLEDGHPSARGANKTFDALEKFKGFTPLSATSYMYDNYVNLTTSMAKMNPGWNYYANKQHRPVLDRTLDPGLIDYIVKARLFNFYLNNGCLPLTKEHALMEKIARNNPWPKPIVVYGYDSTHPMFGGDLFEAETTCVKEHNMGQVATEGVSNLAFFSRKPRITTPLQQVSDPPLLAYNKSKTYMAFIIGDGDNVEMVKGQIRGWMQDRVSRCAKDHSRNGCFPLVWSMSPHTLHLAPDIIRWYYNQTYSTQRDYFVLPPSGHLYSYPSLMSQADQAAFVHDTEQECLIMNTSGTVAWEFFGSWSKAIKDYFPQYADKGIVRSLYAVDVPYLLPTGTFLPGEHYKVLGGKTVLFAPREWRGTSGKSSLPLGNKFVLTAKDMAAEINGFPKGTVSHIYMTQDGGANLGTFYDLVPLLDEHVEIVNHNVLASMALQRERILPNLPDTQEVFV